MNLYSVQTQLAHFQPSGPFSMLRSPLPHLLPTPAPAISAAPAQRRKDLASSWMPAAPVQLSGRHNGRLLLAWPSSWLCSLLSSSPPSAHTALFFPPSRCPLHPLARPFSSLWGQQSISVCPGKEAPLKKQGSLASGGPVTHLPHHESRPSVGVGQPRPGHP